MDKKCVRRTIAIIGAGSVGSTIAQALILRHIGGDLLLVDIDAALCRAQVADLSDCMWMSNTKIRVGTHQEAGQADIIIVSAGAKQKEGEDRVGLIGRNVKVLDSVFGGMRPIRGDAVVLLIANPVDSLTYYAQQLSGLPKSQVLGSGTLLDSIRLRGILAQKLEVAETDIHAYVIGEHGDSQCIAWSTASVSGIPLAALLPLSNAEKASIAEATKRKAYEIIASKGFTSYGIGAVTASICEAIISEQGRIFPVCHWQEAHGCCFSLPAVVGRGGVVKSVELPLNEEEKAAIQKSAEEMRGIIEKMKETKG